MATSSEVTTGDQATATQYNNLRTDALVEEVYTELVGTVSSFSNVWTDWDISSLLPAGVRNVEIIIIPPDAGNVGVRTNGSALVRSLAGTAGSPITMWVRTDASQIIERYSSGSSSFKVMGYQARP